MNTTDRIPARIVPLTKLAVWENGTGRTNLSAAGCHESNRSHTSSCPHSREEFSPHEELRETGFLAHDEPIQGRGSRMVCMLPKSRTSIARPNRWLWATALCGLLTGCQTLAPSWPGSCWSGSCSSGNSCAADNGCCEAGTSCAAGGGCANGTCTAGGACANGCCAAGGTRRICGPNLYFHPIDQLRVCAYARRQANCALAQQRGTSCHFREGFTCAYLDLAQGGTGIAPAVPPERYWNCFYRCHKNYGGVADWYAGYQAGVATARESGFCEEPAVALAATVGQGSVVSGAANGGSYGPQEYGGSAGAW